MTRENKLALVVGFGLILLVGILISDHFSQARMQDPAELAPAIDPLRTDEKEAPDLLALGSPPPSAADRSAPDLDRAASITPAANRLPAVDPVVPGDSVPVTMGGRDTASAGGVGLSPAVAGSLPYRYHHVTANESLGAICRHYYGDASLVDELARVNGIKDPNVIQLGQRLRIPSADELVRGHGGAAAPPPAGAGGAKAAGAAGGSAAAPSGTYEVKEGDVLSVIAQKLLGSARRWEQIYEANRDLLDSPDDIRPGMKLRIPARNG